MSRFGDDDYDEQFPNQGAFWEANMYRALRGRRGRAALTELREALLALPQRRLIEGAMCNVRPAERADREFGPARDPGDPGYPYRNWGREAFAEDAAEQGEGVCLVGAMLWWRKVKAGTDPEQAFDELPTVYGGEDGDGGWRTAELAQTQLGLVPTLAWHLAHRNDEWYGGMTPEQRWEKFLAWIDEELAATAPATT